jgi:predicted metalloendopeptidase
MNRHHATRAAAVLTPLAATLVVLAAQHAARPQDDLYSHANARWLETAVIPADHARETAATALLDRVDADIRTIIDDLAAAPNRRAGSSAQQVVDLYTSVTDEATLDRLGAAPLRPVLDAIDRIDSVRALAEHAGRLQATTTAGPFFVSLRVHPRDADARLVQVAQGGLLMNRALYLKDDARSREIREGYRRYLARTFALVGRASAEPDADAVLALEILVARAQTDATTPASVTLTLGELGREAPGFDWLAWARPQGLYSDATVVLAQPGFFRAFGGLAVRIPLSTWRAWLAARYVTAMSPHTSAAIEQPRFEFFGRQLAGQQAPRLRWRRAVALVNAALPDAVGRPYAERRLSNADRDRVAGIGDRVLRAFRRAVPAFDWPTPAARSAAESRLARVSIRVGAPAIWRDARGLRIAPDDLFGNIGRIHAFENARRMAQLGRAAAPGQWPVGPQTVNAFFHAPSLEVMLPAAILQPPYFDPAASDATNYGAIGAIIGHEIGHALNASDRRTPAGRFTESDNDAVGLAVAFQAWSDSVADATAAIDRQARARDFFLSWARICREKIRPEYAQFLALSSPYLPGSARANAAAARLDGFAGAFGVVPGDRLFVPPTRRLRLF